MSKRVMIAGYYGAKNTGDEAILTGMIHSLRLQGITDITVLSRRPEETKQIHGVNSLYIGRRFDGVQEIYRKMKQTDLFILGGGGLLQDYTRRVVPYWLSRVSIALVAGTPVMYYAQGMGPLRTPFARRLVKLISNRVKQITLRDQPSYELLQEIGVDKPKITVTADPALAIQIESDGKALLQEEGIPIETEYRQIAVSLRPWKDEMEYLPTIVESLKRLKEKMKVQLIFFPFQYGEDERISKQVMDQLGEENMYLVKKEYTPEQIAAMLKEMDGVLAMRLHAIILSAISHVPSFGIVYDPKVRRFMERAKMDFYSWQLEELASNSEEFVEHLEEWVHHLDNVREEMKQPVNQMVQISLQNAELAAGISRDK